MLIKPLPQSEINVTHTAASWSPAVVRAMNAFVLTQPAPDVQRLFEERVALLLGCSPHGGNVECSLTAWAMRNKLTPVRGSLPECIAVESASKLQDWLTDSIDLMMHAKQAHSKVKDHHFILHVLFEKIYTDARRCVDLISARIGHLGGIAQGGLHVTAQMLGPLDIARGKKHAEEQAVAIAFYVDLMRQTETVVC